MITRILKHLRGIVVFAGLTANTFLWAIPLFLFALLKAIVPIGSFRRLMTRWIMAMGENWVSGNAVILGLKDSDRLDVRGVEGLKRRGWYLVIANHQTWVDIVALQIVLNRRIPLLKFFLKQQLIWFPVLGLAWWALDFPFMKRYSKSYLAKHPEKIGHDLEATRLACEKFRDAPTSVFNFVEGTRFTQDKKRIRNSPFENLLPPRAGGIALAISSMGSMFDAILDITLVYPNRVAQFWDLCCGEFDRVVIDVRQREIEQWMIEGDYERDRKFRSQFHQWVTKIWHEKDGQIDRLLSKSTAS